MVLSTEWSQVEVIDLINDGSGLGFGIVGGRSTGVVIKSILPGGIADKDNRLQSGDHILQIGDVNLRGLAADQVATVLRQAGSQVRMVVARPIEHLTPDYKSLSCTAPIVPTKILTDPEELDRQLQQNGYKPLFFNSYNQNEQEQNELINNSVTISQSNSFELINKLNNSTNYLSQSSPIIINENNIVTNQKSITTTPIDDDNRAINPETERFTVELIKNEYGLGITIAGYVCEHEDLCGIFIKSLNEGSEAYRCGKINIIDRIVEVDGISLRNFTNHEAVEKIKQTGQKVQLTLERYLRGPKFEHLQEALAEQERIITISPIASPSITTLSWIPIESNEDEEEENGRNVEQKVQIESQTTTDCGESLNSDEEINETKEIFIEENFQVNLDVDLETQTKQKWESLIGSDVEIIVANLTKLKGLGISLEGKVDVEGGVELRPRHYIRSILPEGPVGQNGRLNSGDELLEVNGQKLLGIKHVEVVKLLKELPNTVRLVCARKNDENRVINTSQDHEGFETRNILGGGIKNLLTHPEKRLIKSVSDCSLNTSSTVTVTDNTTNNNNNNNNSNNESLQKTKSRSLEVVTNLAMWSDEIEYIDLIKADRGLGFSILDYQDPLDSKSTVIVVRSLIPNGSAELDGRIKPGDRLISVNGKLIKNVTLDQAVQALKSTLPGIVHLGISKPLPNSRPSETISNQTIGS